MPTSPSPRTTGARGGWIAILDPATGEGFDEAPDQRPDALDAIVGRAHTAWRGGRADPAAYGRPVRGEIHWRPLGPVAAIVPWNLPLQLASATSAPALAAGNTMVATSARSSCTVRLRCEG